MKTWMPALALAVTFASCGSSEKEAYGGPDDFVQVRTRGDLDTFAGKDVAVEGKFGHLGGRHGTVTLDSGLVIYIPHFDHYKRGDAWLDYVGRPVRVEGVLHTESTGIDGVNGPLISIRRFEPLDTAK